jgi:phenylacetate-CoA ligase
MSSARRRRIRWQSPSVTSECTETKDGPTVLGDHFYLEIINPETGEPVPDGELGELVFIALTKEALPIMRYRMRDLTRLLPGTARTMRRMRKITGRSDDMFIIRGANVFSTKIKERVLALDELAAHYQIHVSRDSQWDVVRIQVEKSPAAAGVNTAVLVAQIGKSIKDYVGINATIDAGELNSVRALKERRYGSLMSIMAN